MSKTDFAMRRTLTLALVARVSTTLLIGFNAIASISALAYQQTGPAGRSDGTFFVLTCESDEALVGIAGRAHKSIVAIQPICAQVDERGRWMASIKRGPEVGGTGGAEFNARCNNDEVVRAISGTSGMAIDGIAVLCSPLENGRLSITPPKLRQRAGGTAGTPFGPLDCHSEPAQGITGATSEAVMWIALVCNLPSNHQPTADVVSIADLSVDAPLSVGASTVIQLAIRNATGAVVRASWRITVDGAVVASRTNRIPPTADKPITFRVPWTARSGHQRIRAEIDATNTLNEPGFHRINNVRSLDIHVAGINCANGMKPVLTPSGQRCAVVSDINTCNTPGPAGMGPRKKLICATNADCALGYICSKEPCGGVCLRDR